jgi:phosphatidate cytidylyltransferase
MKRILTAAVALPILLYTVWSKSYFPFAVLAVLAVLVALSEFYSLANAAGLRPQNLLGYLAAVAVLGCFLLWKPGWITAVFVLLTLASLAARLSERSELAGSLGSVSATVFGVAYVAVLGGSLVGVRMGPGPQVADDAGLSSKLLMMFFAMVIFTDTGAYYTGRGLGRHKLAPKISPGKTIEGSIGGFIAAVAAGPLCRLTFFPEVPLVEALALGGAIGIVSQIGDLAESMLKRSVGAKDSGSLLPGHGGMLDRIDSILFCAPILYYYSRLFFSRL